MSILVDTGQLVALLDRSDAYHTLCSDLLNSLPDRLLVPTTVVVEVCWLVEERPDVEADFLGSIVAGEFVLQPVAPVDLARTAEPVRAYDFPRGAVDASIVAIAERRRSPAWLPSTVATSPPSVQPTARRSRCCPNSSDPTRRRRAPRSRRLAPPRRSRRRGPSSVTPISTCGLPLRLSGADQRGRQRRPHSATWKGPWVGQYPCPDDLWSNATWGEHVRSGWRCL